MTDYRDVCIYLCMLVCLYVSMSLSQSACLSDAPCKEKKDLFYVKTFGTQTSVPPFPFPVFREMRS